jgi:hypothetical protein
MAISKDITYKGITLNYHKIVNVIMNKWQSSFQVLSYIKKEARDSNIWNFFLSNSFNLPYVQAEARPWQDEVIIPSPTLEELSAEWVNDYTALYELLKNNVLSNTIQLVGWIDI